MKSTVDRDMFRDTIKKLVTAETLTFAELTKAAA